MAPTQKTTLASLLVSMFLSTIAVTQIEAAPLTLVKQLDPHDGSYTDVWGEGDFAYVGSRGDGVAIFDISDPADAFLAAHYLPTTDGFWDVKVDNGIGYFARNGGGGLHIVDLSDPANPSLLTILDSANGGGFDNIHNVSIGGIFLFQSGFSENSDIVKVFDISNPSSPTFVRDIATGTTSANGNPRSHDMTVLGNRLYTANMRGGTTDIYDISGMSVTQAPALLGSFPTGGLTHSNWATPDGSLLVNAQEFNGASVKLYDISDPTNVVLLSEITAASAGTAGISPHNPIIVGDQLYVSWNQAGVLVYDISDPSNPVQSNSFDTFPGPLGGPNGNWGVYPLLGSDRILLSDTDGGLFIVSDVAPEPSGDFDTDGDVDGADFLAWQRDTTIGNLADWQENFGATAAAATEEVTSVPEPSSLCLVLLGLAFLTRFATHANTSDHEKL